MRARALLGASAALLALLAGRAGAALPCHVVTDALGDASPLGTTPPPGVPNVAGFPDLDISSGDVASNRDAVTAVIRVARYAPGSARDGLGRMYLASFKANTIANAQGQPAELFLLYTERALDAGRASWGVVNTTFGIGTYVITGNAAAVVDPGRSEVRITLRFDAFPLLRQAFGASRAELRDLTLRTFLYDGEPTDTASIVNGAPLDDATAPMRYRPGTPTCIRVGS